MTTVAVVGPGAIGSTVAAWLAQDGELQVTLCARSAVQRLEIHSPRGVISASPPVLTDPASATAVDWVVFAVKTYDAPKAAAWLERLQGPDTRVAVLQNGVEHIERLRPHVDAARIVPVVVDIPAERLAPGIVRQRRGGTLVAPSGPDGEAFAALFSGTVIEASVTDDFVTVAWRKLALNAAGAVCAALGQPSGIAEQEPIAELICTVVRETVLVGRAEGALLGDDLPDAVVIRMRANAPLFVNSLQADRMAGRPTEIEARNGVVVRRGALHGIATPANAVLVALIGSSAVEGAPRPRFEPAPGHHMEDR